MELDNEADTGGGFTGGRTRGEKGARESGGCVTVENLEGGPFRGKGASKIRGKRIRASK